MIRRDSGVMMAETGWSRLVSKRRSRLVTMPTTLPPSITGRPENLCCRVSDADIADRHRRRNGDRVLDHTRFEALDLGNLAACSLGVKFLSRTMPIPPSWARVMARLASVTVSMAAETKGG